MVFDDDKKTKHLTSAVNFGSNDGKVREARLFPLSEEEINIHNEFLQKKIKNAIWLAEDNSDN